MEQPKFKVGEKVKFINDHDRMMGDVVSFTYSSDTGYVYKISSKAYDFESNSMVDGFKICKESEVVSMEGK